MELKMYHYEWDDTIYINNNRIIRIYGSKDEGSILFLEHNIIEIKWDNWGIEYFGLYNNNYYVVEKIDNIYYVDYINNIVYKDNEISYFDYIDNNNYLGNWSENKFINNNNFIIKNDSSIPNIIHFIFGLIPQNEEFNMYRYIAVKSAYDVNKPDKIYFYYFYEPYGYWWDKTKELFGHITQDQLRTCCDQELCCHEVEMVTAIVDQ